jgi:predicted transcriptional regulator
MSSTDQNKALLGLTAQIVSAHVNKNSVATHELPALIEQVYAALANVGAAPVPVPVEKPAPVVPAKRSVFPDYIICLEDGRKLKTLKRHLRSTYDLSPEQYREKWGLAADYPMVAPNYAEHRSRLAKQLGLGRKPAAAEDDVAGELDLAPPAPPKPVAKPAPEPVVLAPRPAEVKRPEPTAASVFAGFPKRDRAEEETRPEPKPEDIGGKTKRRQPFSKQRARTMRP